MYLLTVEDGRLVKAVPDPEGPLNQGRGCVKGMSIVEREETAHPTGGKSGAVSVGVFRTGRAACPDGVLAVCPHG